MPRSYVTEVETSIKLGGKASLSPRTLVVGKNRSGKSTLINGIEAAGSGRVSDVAGRATLALDAELATLGGDQIFARASLSSGEVASWILTKGKRAQRSGPAIAFPLRDVREALLGSPDKARRWILQNGGGIEWDDVEQLVPDALKPKLRSLIFDATAGDDAAARLAQAIDESKKRIREANSRAKSKPTAPAGPPPSKAEIEAAEALVSKLSGPSQAGLVERLAEVRKELPAARDRVSGLEGALAKLQTSMGSLPATAPVPEVVKSALLVIETLAKEPHGGVCLICGGAVAPGALAARAKVARDRVGAAIAAAAKRGELEADSARVSRDLEDARKALSGLVAEEERLAKLVPSGPDSSAAASLPEGDLSAARAALQALHARAAGHKLAREAETESLQAEQDSLAWGQLAEALSRALGQLVEKARRGFEARVQAFLPASWVFGVDLLDGEREVLRVGLRGETGLRSALSGAEWATVTAALALATAPADGPVVIAPEERAFDPETLASVMESFGSVVEGAQVVLTSPVDPARVPEGWSVVRVGGDKASTGPEGWMPITTLTSTRPGGWEKITQDAPETPKPRNVNPVTGRGPGRPRKDGSPAQRRAAAVAAIAKPPENVGPPETIKEEVEPSPSGSIFDSIDRSGG